MYPTLLVLSVVVFLGVSVVYVRQPSASIFNPATWYLAYHGIVLVFRPILGWIYGYESVYRAMAFTPTLWDKSKVLIICNLGLLVFMAVSIVMTKTPYKFDRREPEIAQRAELLKRFWVVAVPLGGYAVYVLAWIWIFNKSGSRLSSIDDMTGGTMLTADGLNGYMLAAGKTLGIIVVVIVYLSRFNLASLLLMAGFVILQFGTGARNDVICASVMLLLLYLFDRRRKWPYAWLIAPALAVFAAFLVVGSDRGAAIRSSFGVELNSDVRIYTSDATKPLETIDLANMEFMEYLVSVVPEKSGTYDYFLNNLQIFTAPIPRFMWKDKPVGAPIVRFPLYKYGRPLGATYSVVGMGWYSFGYIGVVLWSALFAAIYSYGYQLFVRGKQGHLKTIAYCAFLAPVIISFRDGYLLTLIQWTIFYMVPVVLLAVVVRFVGVSALPGLDTADVEGQRDMSFLSAATPQARRRAAVQQQSEKGLEALSINSAMTPHERRLARMAQP